MLAQLLSKQKGLESSLGKKSKCSVQIPLKQSTKTQTVNFVTK